MQHIPSIAFSSCNYDENADLTPLRDGVLKVVKMVLEKGLTALEVAIPIPIPAPIPVITATAAPIAIIPDIFSISFYLFLFIQLPLLYIMM